ncbi:MAG: glycine betaine/L-proline ABC transporter ATP-binding protein [Bacillota bacterium]
MTDAPPKIAVRDLYKVFGPDPQRALELVRSGVGKDELLKSTGHTLAVAGVNLEVRAGETFIIMGLSGSGKSTLLRCINRLIEPTHGQVLIDGVDVGSLSPRDLRNLRRRRLGMVFQRFALFPHRTVLDNVAYGLEIQGVPPSQRRRRALEVLELVGLAGWAQSYPSQLSGGMQQRVGLARALAPDPDILLMDEPFSALDPLIRRDMQDELIDLQERLHKTIVFITHDLDEALKLGDRIAIMRDGRVVQVGRPEQILLEPADEYVASFVEGVDRSRVLRARDVMQPASPLLRVSHSPSVAVREMEQRGVSSAFVVGPNRRLAGLITVDAALEAVEAGRSNLRDEVNADDVVTVDPDTPLEDLIPLAVEAHYPIAVVDDDGVLKGIILRVSVLRGLMRRRGADHGAVVETAGGARA